MAHDGTQGLGRLKDGALRVGRSGCCSAGLYFPVTREHMIPGLGESLDVRGRQGNEHSNPEHQQCKKRTSVVHCPALSDPESSFYSASQL